MADLICFYDIHGDTHMLTDSSAARCTLNTKDTDICENGADEGTCMTYITEGSNYKTGCINDPSCQWETDSKTWIHGDPQAVSINCTSPDENFARINCDAFYYHDGWWPAKVNTPSPAPGQECAFGATFKSSDGNVPVYTIDDKKQCPHGPST